MLEDKTCVVTGSSRGIGRGIAEEFGARGANVVVNYRSSDAAAEATAETIRETGGKALTVQADVTDREAIREMAKTVHEAFGPVEVLVNNAGLTVDTRFQTMTYEEWDTVMDVNLTGTFNCTKAFYGDLTEAEEGRLINISSVIGKQGNFGQANYATAKSGLFGFTRSIALELAGHDATANCVAPGYTRTEMVESVPEETRERIRERIPLDRFAEVEEIACVVRFLAGEESSYITGEVIDVNGAIDL